MIPKNKTRRLAFYTLALLAALFATGCAQQQQDTNLQPPLHTAENTLDKGVKYAVDVYDPMESINRRIYMFNYYFDKFIFLPVVYTYEFITPDYVEDRVSDFVDNVFEFNNFTNNLLQLKINEATITLARFVVNTTFGIAGLWDVATDLGIERKPEDFGQTLGHYGVGHGPYIVLPILGPSNLRDTTGVITDTVAFAAAGPPAWVDDEDISLAFNVVAAIDKRHRQSFRYYRSGSPFEYELVRLLYTSKREIEIDK